MGLFVDLKKLNKEEAASVRKKAQARHASRFLVVSNDESSKQILISGLLLALLLAGSVFYYRKIYKENSGMTVVRATQKIDFKKEAALLKKERTVNKELEKKVAIVLQENEESKSIITALRKEKESIKQANSSLSKGQIILSRKIENLFREKETVESKVQTLNKKAEKLERKSILMSEQVQVTKDFLLKSMKAKEKAKVIYLQEIAQRDELLNQKIVRSDRVQPIVERAKKLEEDLVVLKSAFSRAKEDSHYNLGVSYEDLGMYEDAVEEYKKGLELNSDASDIHYNIAILYDDFLEDNDLALFHYNKFLEIVPDDESAERVRAWIKELVLP